MTLAWLINNKGIVKITIIMLYSVWPTRSMLPLRTKCCTISIAQLQARGTSVVIFFELQYYICYVILIHSSHIQIFKNHNLFFDTSCTITYHRRSRNGFLRYDANCINYLNKNMRQFGMAHKIKNPFHERWRKTRLSVWFATLF